MGITRRGAITTGGAVLAASLTASVPARRRGVVTFVFVTGANGSAQADPELALRGHRTVAVELPGHGPEATQFTAAYQAPQDLAALAAAPSPMAGITLADYVAATVAVVRRAARHGPVILVGGSMGGATITGAANAVPELIDRLVYVSAFCCAKLRSIEECLATPEARTSRFGAILPGAVGDPAKLGAVRINWRTADRTFLNGVKQALMADASEAEFLAMLNSSLPDDTLHVSGADARGGRGPGGGCRVRTSGIRGTRASRRRCRTA
ncbi:alpha/beta fold hydrolase [Thermocatellispora tengchongensis]|uniref:alpha/beta fold hydrolase n=1 Tax=Thermocatellispora tengchongensis TaxID=1073253 RepID=UPI003636928E